MFGYPPKTPYNDVIKNNEIHNEIHNEIQTFSSNYFGCDFSIKAKKERFSKKSKLSLFDENPYFLISEVF